MPFPNLLFLIHISLQHDVVFVLYFLLNQIKQGFHYQQLLRYMGNNSAKAINQFLYLKLNWKHFYETIVYFIILTHFIVDFIMNVL